jgi:DNA-binding protein H-NS
MSKLEQLLAQRAAMDEAIAAEKNKGRDEALATVRGLCKQYGITMREVKAFVLERKPRAGKDGAAVAKKRVVRKSATGAKRGRPAKK